MDYRKIQGQLRARILKLHQAAGSGHIGCSLSCIDIMLSIFSNKSEQDTFILSKGHAATALYTILNYKGYIPDADLEMFYRNGTTLPAHPAPLKYAAIPFATGSLGHGLPLATGIAKAAKLKGNGQYSYVLMSDGETNEGTSWEAAHFARAHKLDNLVVYIDRNGLQGFGNTIDILGDTSRINLWRNMGFEAIEVDGHNVPALMQATEALKANRNGQPKLIIAHTVKGSGISPMENKMEWHYLPMTAEIYQAAQQELDIRYIKD
jgi:transketolase